MIFWIFLMIFFLLNSKWKYLIFLIRFLVSMMNMKNLRINHNICMIYHHEKVLHPNQQYLDYVHNTANNRICIQNQNMIQIHYYYLFIINAMYIFRKKIKYNHYKHTMAVCWRFSFFFMIICMFIFIYIFIFYFTLY